jgi:hypothetical protein
MQKRPHLRALLHKKAGKKVLQCSVRRFAIAIHPSDMIKKLIIKATVNVLEADVLEVDVLEADVNFSLS